MHVSFINVVPMLEAMRQRQTTLVDRPREEVFAYLADPTNLPRWIEAVDDVELLEEPEQRPGDRRTVRFNQHVEAEEGTGVFEGERAGVQAPRRVTYRFAGAEATLTTTYRLKPEGGSTRVEQELDVPLTRLSTKVLAPVLYLANRRRLIRQLDSLKAALEASAGRD